MNEITEQCLIGMGAAIGFTELNQISIMNSNLREATINLPKCFKIPKLKGINTIAEQKLD